MSSSVDSLKSETLKCKVKRKLYIQRKREKFDEQAPQRDDTKQRNFGSSKELCSNASLREMDAIATSNDSRCDSSKLMRKFSEPFEIYSTHSSIDGCDSPLRNNSELIRQNSAPVLTLAAMRNVQTSLKALNAKSSETTSSIELPAEGGCTHNLQSPIVKNRFRNVYAVHTSTPSSLLRRSLATNDYILTPLTNNDKSMSPITQSATKMTKAMQVIRYDVTL